MQLEARVSGGRPVGVSGCETPASFLAGARSHQATPGCEASVLSPSETGSQQSTPGCKAAMSFPAENRRQPAVPGHEASVLSPSRGVPVSPPDDDDVFIGWKT